MTAGRVWVSAHIFHSGDVDRLLIEAVGPAIAELRRNQLCTDWFFLRYWEGGPHLRVRFSVSLKTREFAAGSFAERVRAYLCEHESPRWPTPSEYAAVAKKLATRERMDRWDRVLHERDSVDFIEYVPEMAKFGAGSDLEVMERHFVDSSELAYWLISSSADTRHRHTAATTAILSALLTGGRVGGGLAAKAATKRTSATRMLANHVARTMALPEGEQPEGFVKEWIATTWRVHARFSAKDPFRAAFLVDYCSHLLCNRLGISPAQERELRFAATEALATAPIAKSGLQVLGSTK